MGKIQLANRLHKWEKTNLVTLKKGRLNFDTHKCTKCGITAKRFGVNDSLDNDKENDYLREKFCMGPNKALIGQSIKITHCLAIREHFGNAFPNSIHKIIKEPSGEVNGGLGVWIMGLGAPIMLLWNEFDFIPTPEKPKFVRTKKPISRFTRTKK